MSGRLSQGIGGCIEVSNTIYFIPRSAVPPNKTVTCGRFVVDVRPNKEEVHRVRLTVGGNLIEYDGDVLTRSADLTTSKCLWNSVISTMGAKYMCLDVKNLQSNTPSLITSDSTRFISRATLTPWSVTYGRTKESLLFE
jgi:hypothetical protein